MYLASQGIAGYWMIARLQFCFRGCCLFPQDALQDFPARALWYLVHKHHPSRQSFIASQVIRHMTLKLISANRSSWPSYYVSPRLFVSLQLRVVNANDGAIFNVRMAQEHAFEFGRGNLETSNLDQFLKTVLLGWIWLIKLRRRRDNEITDLLSIHDIPFLCLSVTVHNVPSL